MQRPIGIKEKILKFTENDERIRAVLLNGSRANSNVKPDKYQDFDLIFIVQDFATFLDDRNWISSFGTPILQQLPDEMTLGNENNKEKVSFAFLTIFEDGNRIDLTLFPREKFETDFITDSLTLVWLDKENLFKNITKSSDKDYHVKKPAQQEFSEVCNEFWWTITYVAKGLKRNEIIYAKDTMENVVRPMFIQIIEWKIGFDFDFKISIGKSGKFIEKYLESSFYEKILRTYSDADIENNWNALLLMTKIFKQQQTLLSQNLNFNINEDEANNSLKYIEKLREE